MWWLYTTAAAGVWWVAAADLCGDVTGSCVALSGDDVTSLCALRLPRLSLIGELEPSDPYGSESTSSGPRVSVDGRSAKRRARRQRFHRIQSSELQQLQKGDEDNASDEELRREKNGAVFIVEVTRKHAHTTSVCSRYVRGVLPRAQCGHVSVVRIRVYVLCFGRNFSLSLCGSSVSGIAIHVEEGIQSRVTFCRSLIDFYG